MINGIDMVLVWNMKNVIFIHLSQLVRDGVIRIFDKHKNNVHSRPIHNSNYEKVNMGDLKGDLTIKITFDRQTITRQITID